MSEEEIKADINLEQKCVAKASLESESDEEMTEPSVPPIEDTIPEGLIDQFSPYYERYYKKKYCTTFTKDVNLDTCFKLHSNRVALLFLSEKHSIIQKKQRISHIDFVSKNVDRSLSRPQGKSKRGAQYLQPSSLLCQLKTTDGESYPVYAGLKGKLLEVNERLKESPNIIVDDLDEGFLAIILPDLQDYEQAVSVLKSPNDYNS